MLSYWKTILQVIYHHKKWQNFLVSRNTRGKISKNCGFFLDCSKLYCPGAWRPLLWNIHPQTQWNINSLQFKSEKYRHKTFLVKLSQTTFWSHRVFLLQTKWALYIQKGFGLSLGQTPILSRDQNLKVISHKILCG